MSGHRAGVQGPLHQGHIGRVAGVGAEVPVCHILATKAGKLGQVKNRGSWAMLCHIRVVLAGQQGLEQAWAAVAPLFIALGPSWQDNWSWIGTG